MTTLITKKPPRYKHSDYKPRTITIDDGSFKKAVRIGDGNASYGIRAALKAYKEKSIKGAQ